jgi:hypothetical protein
MAQQTAVELLYKESDKLITQYLDGKIDKRELLTMHHNILYSHKEVEKDQIAKAWDAGFYGYFSLGIPEIEFNNGEEYYNINYNESYKK